MTDGIIQQTFEPYLVELHEIVIECRQEDNDSEYTKVAEQRLNKLMKLEKELIEKIKRESNVLTVFSDYIPRWQYDILIRTLIGDNQE